MRLVAHAAIRPHRCAVIPFIANSNTAEGFIDTGYDLPGWDPHVYVSVQAVKEMARLIGWGPQLTDPEPARLKARVAELEAQVADRDGQIAAFGVLKRSKAIQEPRPPGRPRKEAKV